MDHSLSWDLGLKLTMLKASLGLSRKETLVNFTLLGLVVMISQREASTKVVARVKDITVLNLSPDTIYQKVSSLNKWFVFPNHNHHYYHGVSVRTIT